MTKGVNQMASKILKYLVKAMDYSKRAVIGFKLDSNEPFLYNTNAIENFGDENGVIDIKKIFSPQETTEHWKTTINTELKEDGCAMLYDLSVLTNKGTTRVADVQIGYADDENKVLFIEFFYKEDTRMEQAISQVNQSTRAEAILEFDEYLTLICANKLFQDIFNSSIAEFSNSLRQQQLNKEIHSTLSKAPTYFTKISLSDKWYSLELQRRTLDSTGKDKLMAYLVNIDELVEMETELEQINNYFEVLQSLSSGKLYRFDIKNRILYRSSDYSQTYNLPVIGNNYPDLDNLKNVIHPEDLPPYIEYIEKVATGQEGSIDTRVKLLTGEYEYHNMTFKALRANDGSIKEMIGFGQNVNSIRETEEQLNIVSQYFDAIQNLSDDMLYRVNINTKTLYRTSDQAKMFGLLEVMENYPQSIIDSGIIHPDDEKNYRAYGEKLLEGHVTQTEVRVKSFTGEYQYHRLTCTPVYDKNNNIQEMFGKIINIQNVLELEEQAKYDALTKALNKRAMLEETSKCINTATPTDKHALFFMDLDNFKYVNDNLGHAFGDYLLAELGKRLTDSVRQNDMVGRVGGDEFVIFLRDIPSIDVALGKAKLLLSTISEDFNDGTIQHNMQGSIGVAIFPEHGNSYEELYHHADLALYSSKHKGKNTVTIYTSDLNQ